MEPDISIIALLAALFGLILIVITVRSFRMPEEHYKNRRQRDELRQLLLKNRLTVPVDDDVEVEGGKPGDKPGV